MKKNQINQIVVLTEQIGSGCKTVEKDTICRVYQLLDETHVRLAIDDDKYPATRASNICRFRLPVDETEEKELIEKFKTTSRYVRAFV